MIIFKRFGFIRKQKLKKTTYIKKLVQSQRIDEMKVFGGILIARVMESDTELL